MGFADIDHLSIRTSDRRVFRRCFRKWDFQSSLRGNWEYDGAETNINFWFGSAIHFAMEDYHGYNVFGDPRIALWAYYQAFNEDELPDGAQAMYDIGISMLSYYITWYRRHNEASGFETALLDTDTNQLVNAKDALPDGNYVPAVEQSFMIPLQVWVGMDANERIRESYWGDEDALPAPSGTIYYNPQLDEDLKIIPIYYHGTIDKMVYDKLGRLWLVDYKTAKGADTNKLDTDDQITAYLWAIEKVFGIKPYGFIYLQLTKEPVHMPKRLKNGELSVDKRQKTTYSLVKQEIIDDYGSVQQAPNKIIQFLNFMAEQETPEGDKFIRWDFVKRSAEEIEAHERHIYGELQLMLNPDLYCFPTPTRDCIWDCGCRDYCLALDRADDVAQTEFLSQFKKRARNEDGNKDPWRVNIPWPWVLKERGEELPLLEDVMEYDLNMEIELGSSQYADEQKGFQFQYEKEDNNGN